MKQPKITSLYYYSAVTSYWSPDGEVSKRANKRAELSREPAGNVERMDCN